MWGGFSSLFIPFVFSILLVEMKGLSHYYVDVDVHETVRPLHWYSVPDVK